MRLKNGKKLRTTGLAVKFTDSSEKKCFGHAACVLFAVISFEELTNCLFIIIYLSFELMNLLTINMTIAKWS